jgi:uncharacterized protein YegL
MRAFLLIAFMVAFNNATTIQEIISAKEEEVNQLARSAQSAWSQRCLSQVCSTCSYDMCSFKELPNSNCTTSYGILSECPCDGRKVDMSSIVHLVNEEIREGTELSDTQNHAVCSLKKMEPDFVRIATTNTDPAWRYFGHSSGVLISHPARVGSASMCASYDPRKRPWYIVSSSGPKDVIILLDTSGSMSHFNRFTLAKAATNAVLDTLTYLDWFTIVTFSIDSSAMGTTLMQGSVANIVTAKAYINSMSIGGNTNFEAGFKKTFDIFKESDNQEFTSGCTNSRMVLFLSDGEITRGKPAEEIPDYVTQLNSELNKKVRVMSFSLGRDSDRTVPKQISCATDGVWTFIDDGGDLISQMSSYFNIISLGTERNGVVWTEPYVDAFGLGLMVTAARTVYITTTSGRLIVGVVGIDVTLKEFEKFGDRDSILAQLAITGRICSPIEINECQLENLRGTEGTCNPTVTCDDTSDTIASCPAMMTGTTECFRGGLTVAKRNDMQCCTYCNEADTTTEDDETDNSFVVPAIIAGWFGVVCLCVSIYHCYKEKSEQQNNTRHDHTTINVNVAVPEDTASPLNQEDTPNQQPQPQPPPPPPYNSGSNIVVPPQPLQSIRIAEPYYKEYGHLGRGK